MSFLRHYTISQRLIAVITLTLLVVGGLTGLFAYHHHSSLLDSRAVKTRHLVESGIGVMEHFYDREKSGAMSRDQAQRSAKELLGSMRYGDNDYFWIQNRDLAMVHHPFSPHLDGTDLSDIADPDGKHLFVEMEEAVARQGDGFVNYAWPKPGFDQPVDKVSYVKAFGPWGWVLGSGIYLDDVQNDFWTAMASPLVLVLIGLTALVGLTLLVARSIVRPLKRTVNAMEDIASGEGDLTQRLSTDGSDELVLLAQGFNRFADKLSGVISNLGTLVSQNREIAQQASRAMADARNSYDQQKRELDTVASAVEEMSVTAQDVAQRITESADAAQTASQDSSAGQEDAQSTRDAMENLASDIEQTRKAMTQLDEQSGQISGVLDVIRGVAEQTNLLALNAAIEAARAGEQGRGFAVVADEVRTLASRTQSSTDEIREMIDALLSNTARAVASMKTSHEQSEKMRTQVDGVKKRLTTINDSVTTITDMTHHIASAAEEQSQTANTIAASLSQLSSLSDEMLVELNDTAGNTETLNEVSESLEQLIGQFKIEQR